MRALVVDASIGSTAFYSRRPSFIACSREGASSGMEGQILALLDRPAQQPGFLFLLMSSARSTVMKRSSIARQITGNTGDINVRSWHLADIRGDRPNVAFPYRTNTVATNQQEVRWTVVRCAWRPNRIGSSKQGGHRYDWAPRPATRDGNHGPEADSLIRGPVEWCWRNYRGQ